jgi:diguanylate cyclase (GGDEF)-like protein
MKRIFLLLSLALLSGALCSARASEAQALEALLLVGEQRPAEGLAGLAALPAAQGMNALRRRHVQGQLLLAAGQLDDARQLAMLTDAPALFLRARLSHQRGDEAQAARLLDDSLARQLSVCEPRPASACDDRLWHDSRSLRAEVHLALDEVGQAQKLLKQALAEAQRAAQPDRAAELLGDLALLQARQSDLAEATVLLMKAQMQAGDRPWRQLQLKVIESALARQAGNDSGQRQALEQALAMRVDAPRIVPFLQVNLADSYLRASDAERALSLLEAALANEARSTSPMFEHTLRHNLAVALIQLRRFDAARGQMRLSEGLLPEGGQSLRRRAEELRELGRAWAAVGQWRDALLLFHAERQLTETADERERSAALSDLRKTQNALGQESENQLARDRLALAERTLDNQKVWRWLGWLLGALIGLSLLIGFFLWLGSQAANRRLQRKREQLQNLSERDPLTQLSNRRAFLQVMQARGEVPLEGGLLILDLDHFKRINDSQGHAIGDEVLQAVAQRLAAQVRKEDVLARWGGEEFLLYAPGLAMAPLRQLAERLMKAVGGAPLSLQSGAKLQVRASIGFAAFPLAPEQRPFTWERAVAWVDLALYTAKNHGRNRAIGIISANLSDELAQAQVEADFEGAVNAARVVLSQLQGPELKT